MANEFIARNGLIAQNNSTVTGSLNVTGGITGSLLGTASTASYVNTAQTASYILNAVSASFATTSSYALSASYAPDTTFPYTGSAKITGSLGVTGSISTTSTLDVAGTTTLSGNLTSSANTLSTGIITISRGIDAYVSNLNINSGTSNTSVFQFNTDQPNSKVILDSRNNYSMGFYTNDVERLLLGTSLFTVRVPTTITGSTIIRGNTTITGSLETTGSVKFLVTGSDLVNIGNKVTTGQRLIRIGQDTAFADIGSLVGTGTAFALYTNQVTPTSANYTLLDDGSSIYLNGKSANSLYLQVAATSMVRIGPNFQLYTPAAAASGATVKWQLTIPSDTNQTAGSNIPNAKILNGNKQWATGNISSQYWVHVTAPTASAVGTSNMTGSHTLFVERASAGSNMNIIGNYAAGFSGSIQVLLGGINVTGSSTISGSLNVTGDITGSIPFVSKSYFTQGILGTDQTIPQSVDTVIEFVDHYDPQNWLNATTHRFQPTVAGYYDVSLGVWWSQFGDPNQQCNIQARLNGSTFLIAQSQTVNVQSGLTLFSSKIQYMNGSTDYIDFTAYQSADPGGTTLQQGTSDGSGTHFSIIRLNV